MIKQLISWLIVIASIFIFIFGSGFLISLGLKSWLGILLGFAIAFLIGWGGIRIARVRR